MDHRDIDGGPGYDADLESRLYAEIHYSNDTYPDQMPAGSSPGNNHNGHVYPSNNPIPSILNQYPSMSSRYRSHPNAHPRPHQNSWRLDSRPNFEPQNSAMYSRNYQGVGISSNYNNSSHQQPSMNYSRNNEMYSKRPRPLLDSFAYPHSSMSHHYDYMNDPMSFSHLPNDYENPSMRNRVPPHSSVSPASLRRNNDIDIGNHKQLRRNPSRKARTQNTVAHKKSSASTKRKTGKNKASGSNKNTSSQRENTTTATNSKNTFDNSVEDIRPPGTEETTSKYDVAAKSNQPQELNPSEPRNSVEITSDSDESIFEVPVPPKPKPLLIDLKDSDEASSSDDDEEQSPVVMSEKSQILQQQQQEQPLSTLPPLIVDENTNSSSAIVPTIISSSESTQELPDENINPPTINTNTEELSNDIDSISNNIIINCTQVATGVTTLADIKRIRESTNAPPTTDGLSDDSMTESEAMKWGQIEGQMGDNNGDKSADNDWNQLPRNSKKTIDKTADAQSTSKSVETVAKVIDETPSPGTRTTQINAKRKRSQQSESELEINNELNNSANNVDRNRTKRPAKEKSFEESLHEPRPKKLETFYNEPRPGIMMLDVHKIQSRMPFDPNRWAILDADKGYTVNMRDRKRKCSLCHREGHLRDKCPNHRQVPTCHMCGEVGHFEPRCPHSMCLTCGKKFSSYRKTCENCRNTKCSMCKSVGHTKDTCPDLWRRYHQTTTGASVVVPTNPLKILKSPNELSCCNCSRIGHHSSNCKNYRWSQHFISPRFVTSYTKGPCYISDDATNEDGDGDITIDSLNDTINSTIEETAEISKESSTTVQLLYEYSTVPPDAMKTWLSQTIDLSIFRPRFHISQWKNKFIEPTFLRTQFPPAVNCQFSVQIDQLPGLHKYNLILKAASHECLVCLKKLMMQWLDRRETDDQLIMNNSDPLPWTKADLLEFLSKELCQFVGSITARDVKRAIHILPTSSDIYKSLPETDKERFIMTIHRTKREAVALAYNRGLVSNATNILGEFKIFMKQLAFLPIADNHPIPPDIYMSAVWFRFELFSPSLSNKILRSICKYDKRKKRKKKKGKSNLNQNENSEIRPELFPEIFDEHEIIALFAEIKRAPKINPDPVTEVNTSAPVYGNKLDTTRSIIDGVIQDIGNGSNHVTFLNEQMLFEPTAQTQSEPIKQTGDGNEKGTSKVAIPKNTNVAAKKSKIKQKNGKRAASEMSKALPKPRAKHFKNKSEILNYVYNASMHARHNDLKALIPRIDHMIDRAKLGLVVGEELMGLWQRSRAAQKMGKGKVTIKKKSLNLNPRKI